MTTHNVGNKGVQIIMMTVIKTAEAQEWSSTGT